MVKDILNIPLAIQNAIFSLVILDDGRYILVYYYYIGSSIELSLYDGIDVYCSPLLRILA